MPETRRSFLAKATAAAAGWAMNGPSLCGAAAPGFLSFDPGKNIIPAPLQPELWPEFRRRLINWRQETRQRLNYDASLYRDPAFAWSAANYSCCFVMMCDAGFYNPETGAYQASRWVEEGLKEFGGFDSLVLWHAYPRIGVDERNQFDFYRDMPGGLGGVREAVHQFQQRGVRVYINYNPWDTGTRREDKPDLDVLVEMVRALDVDGIFLDTMTEGAAEFRAKLDRARPGVVLEGEGVLPLERLADHHASWAQHFDDSVAPGLLRHKWIERRHMQHQIRRWKFDHSGELHTAWMNGSGMMVWENVFGSWVGWSARDRSLLRAILPIQRRFRALFSGEDWTPLVETGKPGVFGSLWQDKEVRLWTLVNRGTIAVEGVTLETEVADGQACFDLIAGCELRVLASGAHLSVPVSIPARGVAAILIARREWVGSDFQEFLARQADVCRRIDLDITHPTRQTHLRPAPLLSPRDAVPKGMVVVNPKSNQLLRVEMRLRECGFYDSNTPDEEGYWTSYNFQIRSFERPVPARPYAIDETLVTNGQFAAFLKATGYRPVHSHRFLYHWREQRPPADREDHPVVWVDLTDARAYAEWAGKRLPTEEEWQLAAQGPGGLKFPWGDTMDPERCNGGQTGGTTAVRAFPAGRSPCGCYDMCGNVWQWTESERSDGRTRFCIIRGGAYYGAKGSNWYVDGGPRPADFATKFLLMWPGLDRCATIGFRCVADVTAP